MPAFPAGESTPDYASFMSLVKETGRCLNSFAPPDGFAPDGPEPEMPLSGEAAKALGAGSLRDFFSLALERGEARAVKEREGRLPAFFPRGPESVGPALVFIENKCTSLAKAISELKKNWPREEQGLEAALRPLESALAALLANRAGLIRVERDLWPRLKLVALEWPRDAKGLWQKAQNLQQSVSPLLAAAKQETAETDSVGLFDKSRRSLTRAVMDLKTKVGQGRELAECENAWLRSYEDLLTDLDDYMAVVADGNQADRDWEADSRWLSGSISDLEKEDRRLRDEGAQAGEAIKHSLEALIGVETRLSGHQSSEMLEGLETVGRGVQALWRSVIERRRQMARIYFIIPSRMGRPLFLEKSIMTAAQALGRAQSVLEDLRHQLSLAGGKLSTTNRLRSEGKSLAERLSSPQNRLLKIKVIRKRFSVLTAVVDQRLSLAAARDKLENVVAKGEENERRLNRGRVENSRMYRELKAAAIERERLTAQLGSARQQLSEAGLVKARLLKVFAHKSDIWGETERARQRLEADNEALKAEKAELKLKRSRLAEIYTRERRELKKLTDELKGGQGELPDPQENAELRHDLEKRLDETRREKEAAAARLRELDAQLQERSAQLAAAVAQADSLSLELARHREELAVASRARLSLGEKTAALRRRQDLLAQAHTSLQKALKRKGGQLIRSEAERDGLVARLNRQKQNLLRLVATRQQLRAELGAARLTICDLEKERSDIFSKLSQAQAEILQSDREKSGLSDLAKALADEKIFLLGQMESLAREKDKLKARLEFLADESGGLNGAAEEKARLLASLAGLEEENGRLSFLLSDLEKRNQELSTQLTGLESKVSGELFPFIKIMGQALWRSEAQLKKARAATSRLMGSIELELETKEAQREFELNSADQNEPSETEGRLEETPGGRPAMMDERDYLSCRNEKLRPGLGALKDSCSAGLDQSREAWDDLKKSMAGQEQELKLQKAKLGQLEPLVSYFIASAENGEATANIDPELVAYLKESGRVLGEELSAEENFEMDMAEPESIAIEGGNGAGPAQAARLKARLKEIQPLVSFLARSFVGSVAELAQIRQERSSLSDELAKSKRDNENYSSDLSNLRREEEQLRAELEKMRQESAFLAGQVNSADKSRETLEGSLAARESEFLAAHDQAVSLAAEKDQLQKILEEKKKEIGLLKNELAQADRDLTENDGRLEAAWAALNYLGAKANDTLAGFKDKLETQGRQIENLSLELKKRDMIIDGLEDRQNKLALLFWALASRAANSAPGQLAAANGPALLGSAADDFNFGFAAGDGPSDDNACRSGGYSLGRGILEGVKKVARRSLLTLILAGGLVMSGSLEGQAAQGMPRPEANAIAASVAEAGQQLQSRLDSNYIGRTVSLEMVEADLRLAGPRAVENRLAEMVSELAAGHGLSNSEFLRLVRTARGPEDTIYLDEFKGREGALALLAFHLPKLSRQMLRWPAELLSQSRLSYLMKSVADFKPSEGGFWERMYFDLTADGHSAEEALSFILEAMAHKAALGTAVRPEFAGRLAPFPQLENLGPDRFISFMAGYINENWPKLSGRGRQQAARRLAGDIYFAARLFKLPTTLLSSLIHEEAETDQVDFFRRGSTYAIHARAADLADLTKSYSLVWQEGCPPLCDLDEALASSEKETFVEGVYRRKMSMVMSYNKSINTGSSLFDELA